LNEAIKREDKTEERKKLVRQKRNLLSRLAKVDFDDECRARIGMVLYKTLLDENIIREPRRIGRKITVQLADEVLKPLAENFDRAAGQKPLWGPLVVPPRRWTNNRDGGYHFDLNGRHRLLKIAGRDFCEKNVPAVFSAVNALQGVAFRINRKILDTAAHLLSTVPSRETDELFGISPAASGEKRLWLRVSVNRITAEASRLEAYPRIYYTGFLDFRGRYYCKGTYLNPQGSDLCRGLVEFADAKPIRDDKAERWLRNHGASCYGSEFSRGTHNERERWVRDNEARIVALARDPVSPENRAFLKGADKPWEFLAWSHEWSGFREQGFGYESRLPVAVDGSCNGIQHFAALMRSRELAEQVNLSKTVRPGDIYKAVAEGTERMFRERRNAMTWYASLTLDEVVRKYKDYTGLLSSPLIDGRRKEQDEPVMAARGADDEAEEPAEDPDEEDVEEFDDEPGATGVDEEAIGELKNMEAVLKERWDGLSANKRMECLRECRRQLAECMLMTPPPDSVPAIAFTRKLLKSIVMTFPYSATHNGNAKGMEERLCAEHKPHLDYLGQVIGKRYCESFLPEHILSHAIVRNTRAVIRNIAGDAIRIMNYLKSMAPDDPKKPEISWISPTGLKVRQRYAQPENGDKIALEYSDMKIYLQKPGKSKKANCRKHKQGISPNFVHSCDAAHMMKTVNAAKAAGIDSFLMIHDSYATHAADMEALRGILREWTF
jgi:DNA-directed RNA polymerase